VNSSLEGFGPQEATAILKRPEWITRRRRGRERGNLHFLSPGEGSIKESRTAIPVDCAGTRTGKTVPTVMKKDRQVRKKVEDRGSERRSETVGHRISAPEPMENLRSSNKERRGDFEECSIPTGRNPGWEDDKIEG